MSLFNIVIWLVFGAFVGWLAKWLHPGEEEGLTGWKTVALGLAGSFVGGFINWLLGWGDSMLSYSGLLMSIVGAFICCYLYVNRQAIISWFNDMVGKIRKN